jgi:glyoxylase-like metal-dependent hydrolase (beta-lactamase superfamily II)
LIAYLNKFFVRRTDLQKTLNTVLITHDHTDHDFALRAVVENFTVEHFVDNGLPALAHQTPSGCGMRSLPDIVMFRSRKPSTPKWPGWRIDRDSPMRRLIR